MDRCHLLALGGWDLLGFRRSRRHHRDMAGGEAVEGTRRLVLAQWQRQRMKGYWVEYVKRGSE